MTTETSERIYSASDRFKMLQSLVGKQADVRILTMTGETHLEGVIGSLASPPKREQCTLELRISLGRQYADVEVSSYCLEKDGEHTTVRGYLAPHDPEVFEMKVY